MRCLVSFRHPVTGNRYLFVDFRSNGDMLRPVGCFSYRKQFATVFHTKRDALKVVQYLVDVGYQARIIDI